MKTFKDVLIKALENDKMEFQSVNQNLIEVSKGTKKKAGFIKVAVTDGVSTGMMNRTGVAFILSVDGDELNKIAIGLEKP